LAAAGKTFGKVPQVLHLWRHHENRLTTNDLRYSVERFLACKAHYLARGPLRGISQVVVWGAGQTGRRFSKHLLRSGVRLTAFIDIDTKKVGRTLRDLPIHTPNRLPGLLTNAVDTVILAAVSARGARALIRERLQRPHLVEGRNFWCVA
jgi:NADH/NAD ratio-sensing transcriptional regulator Rex